MNREVHVRICGGGQVQFLPATRQIRLRVRIVVGHVGPAWLRSTPRSISSWATGLEVIEVPRSACRASWSRSIPCRAIVSAMNSFASSLVSVAGDGQPTT